MDSVDGQVNERERESETDEKLKGRQGKGREGRTLPKNEKEIPSKRMLFVNIPADPLPPTTVNWRGMLPIACRESDV